MAVDFDFLMEILRIINHVVKTAELRTWKYLRGVPDIKLNAEGLALPLAPEYGRVASVFVPKMYGRSLLARYWGEAAGDLRLPVMYVRKRGRGVTWGYLQ